MLDRAAKERLWAQCARASDADVLTVRDAIGEDHRARLVARLYGGLADDRTASVRAPDSVGGATRAPGWRLRSCRGDAAQP